MTASRDLIAGAYELPVTGDAMSPRYRPGDRMLVHPSARPHAGEDVLLSRDLGNGARETIMRRLVKATPTAWRVRQFTPCCQSETLDRSQWPHAELIVGMFRGR